MQKLRQTAAQVHVHQTMIAPNSMLDVNHRIALAQLGQRGDHHIDVRGFIRAAVAAARAG